MRTLIEEMHLTYSLFDDRKRYHFTFRKDIVASDFVPHSGTVGIEVRVRSFTCKKIHVLK